jgi:hypothetical protein
MFLVAGPMDATWASNSLSGPMTTSIFDVGKVAVVYV